ncbi:DUF3306 domain-containing protein [Phaeobacter inhibens]|uniref:DUF3306 domain-containing protein n=1 Tax=Phaeobacter inhibens TaxID=221822 RepID=UPI0021A5A6BD|nr:DUF3306 domain-containing protein [Phaeobacter inhibens]UWR91612.1 DUF3306 domain-containing protein [Phaeobacter inhibens]
MSGGNFWSQRRAKVAAEQQAEAVEIAAAARAAEEQALEEKSDAEILEELNLPDPDQMQQGDDFSVFLKETIPARLRTRALRRLWISNPVLANVDGLLDYGEDFSDSAMVIENLQTAYQVGKGMTAHVEELARQAEEAATAEAATDETDIADVQEADVAAVEEDPGDETAVAMSTTRPPTTALRSAEDAVEVEPQDTAQVSADAAVAVVSDLEPAPTATRRMRFRFAAETHGDGAVT